MTGLGVIGTAAAWLNLRKAKAEYEALKEKQEGLQAAILSYQMDKQDEIPEINNKPNDFPSGVGFNAILRVANLVGTYYYAKASVVMTNTSNTAYQIRTIWADCYFKGDIVTSDTKDVNSILAPGETKKFTFDKILTKGEAEQMRDVICEACGKNLITSCPKISIEDGIKSDIKFTWSAGNGGDVKTAYVLQKPGVLRYCMELSLTNE